MKAGIIKLVLRQKTVIFPSAFIVLNAVSAKSYLEASLMKGLVSLLLSYAESVRGP